MTARVAAQLALAVALLLQALHAPRALAQDVDPPAYRSTIDEAVAEFSAGRYEEARSLFKRAHELSPNARTLRGMGMTAFELRMYVHAIRELEGALRETHKPLDPTMRANVQTLAVKARAFVGRVEPQLEPKEARLLVDGAPPQLESDGTLLLDAGTHVLSATADGHKPISVRIAIEGGSDQTLRLPLEPLPQIAGGVPAIDPNAPPVVAPAPAPAATPAPAPASKPTETRGGGPGYQTFAWITLAGAVAFGATSGAFWAIGSSQYSEVEKRCAPTCSERQIDDSGVGTSDLLTTVFLGAAVASGVASGVLFVLAAGEDGGEQSGASARLELGPLGVRVRGTL
jgi:hypothetical protein